MTLTDLLVSIISGMQFLLPESLLFGLVIIIVLTGLIFKNQQLWLMPLIFGFGMSVVLYFDAIQLLKFTQPLHLFSDSILLNSHSIKYKLLLDVIGILFVFFCILSNKITERKSHFLELFSIAASILLGAHFIVLTSNLLLFFLSLEIISLGSYILVCFVFNKISAEASVKYILFGMFASAITLYGISFLYGFTATLNFNNDDFLNNLFSVGYAPACMAIGLTITGILFKLSVFPLYFWVPDVYESTPSSIIAFFSTVSKVGGIGILTKFLPMIAGIGYGGGTNVGLLISVTACLSIAIGNTAAFYQTNFKRMLAYSAIAQSGFLILPLASFSNLALDTVYFYLCIYAVLSFGVFYFANLLQEITGSQLIDSFNGLGKKYLVLGIFGVIILVAIAGLPPTSGFMAKLLIFSSIWESFTKNDQNWYLWVLIFGLLNTVVGIFYYFKPIYNMFLKNPADDNIIKIHPLKMAFVFFLTFGALIFFFFPGLIIK
ncbi:MAG: NADH-quinone oxidoreductase subunit N [Bacteroidota bacterium]|nr:NADH-quinone oxidoreductase subunit N [Bacteroidota bacterium]